MVTRHDVIGSRWSSHFWVKMHVFSSFFNNKSKTCIYVLFYMSSTKKLPFIGILTWFIILGKIQDGDHCWWRYRPPPAPPPIKYTSSCWEHRRLSTKGRIVSKYCKMSKPLGRRFHQPPTPPPPPLLYHGGGMNWRLRPKVKTPKDVIILY